MPPFVVRCYSCTVNLIHLPKEERMSLAQLEAELETRSAFKSKVEDLALAEVDRLSREEETLASALKSVRDELTAAKRVLSAVIPAAPKPEGAPKPKGGHSPSKALSQHRRDELLAWITNNVNEFSVKDVRESTGWSDSQVTTALVIFREESLIRLARMGGPTGTTKFYRSMVGGN